MTNKILWGWEGTARQMENLIEATKMSKITPHKGGRTASLKVRIKPEVLAKLKQIAKARGVSQADVIEKWIEEALG
jgi:predicted HicB family RNase H-like nuclease